MELTVKKMGAWWVEIAAKWQLVQYRISEQEVCGGWVWKCFFSCFPRVNHQKPLNVTCLAEDMYCYLYLFLHSLGETVALKQKKRVNSPILSLARVGIGV